MSRKKLWRGGLVLLCLVGIALSCGAGEVFLNDLGEVARGLCITFSEPVEIIDFGGPFLSQHPSGEATGFIFSGGEAQPWDSLWLSWSPASATVVKTEWLIKELGVPEKPTVIEAAPSEALGEGKEPVFFEDFEHGMTWTAVQGIQADIVSLERGVEKSLHLKGRQEGHWTYVYSLPYRMEPGRKYRFTGWVLVNKVSPAYAPNFLLEFLGCHSDGSFDWNKEFGRMYTNRVLWRGGWQRLSGEYECPDDARWGIILLFKGWSGPVGIDAYIDDIKVVEVDESAAEKGPHFETAPAPLEALKETHPRLHLTEERITELKQKIKTEPYTSLFRELREIADRGARQGPPEYEYGVDQRGTAIMIPELALTYLLTGEHRYLESAKDWMLTAAAYETWWCGYEAEEENKDLCATHLLYGIALGYDWLYHDLDAESRKTIRNCLETRGRFIFESLLNRNIYWQDHYVSGHLWMGITGLATAGLCLYGEVEDVDDWIILPLEMLKEVMASLGPDGASPKGILGLMVGGSHLLKFMDLARDLLDEDLFKDNDWFRNTVSFRVYSMLPKNSWRKGWWKEVWHERSTVMEFGDGPRYDWYGPAYQLWKLASEYRNPYAQWLADAMDEVGLCGWWAGRFLNLLWFDPTVRPKAPTDLPTFKHFDDADIVFMRSGWDGDEALMGFKCGPYIGHHALKRFLRNPGQWHAHPDAGAFQLFAFGGWLIVDDGHNGYTFKSTAYQNTALINGIGQIGEGNAGLDMFHVEDREATILRAEPGEDFDYVIGDATPAYKEEAGLKKFLRHILYIKPSCWVILDELEAQNPSKFELLFHADFPFQRLAESSYAVSGSNGSLCLKALLPNDVVGQTMKQPIKAGDVKAGEGPLPIVEELNLLKLSNETKRRKAFFVTVLDAHPTSSKPRVKSSIEETEIGKVLTIETDTRTFRFILHPDREDPSSPIIEETK